MGLRVSPWCSGSWAGLKVMKSLDEVFNDSLNCLKRSVFSSDRCPNQLQACALVCVASPWRMFVLECGLSRDYPSNPRADPASTEPLRHVGFNMCPSCFHCSEGRKTDWSEAEIETFTRENFEGFSEIFSPQEVSKSSWFPPDINKLTFINHAALLVHFSSFGHSLRFCRFFFCPVSVSGLRRGLCDRGHVWGPLQARSGPVQALPLLREREEGDWGSVEGKPHHPQVQTGKLLVLRAPGNPGLPGEVWTVVPPLDFGDVLDG